MLNCDIRSYGAVGDGAAMNTAAIQAAIDDCASHGGGRVTLSEGRYLCGFIALKSGVELHIERDAVLLGSTDAADYPEIETDFWLTEYAPRFNKRCFIYAEDCEDVAITGRGAIDCQGEAYIEPLSRERAMHSHWPYARKPHPALPGDENVDPFIKNIRSYSPGRVVLFMGCKNVLVEDVTLRNSPAGWGYWICGCDRVYFHRAQILASVLYPNNDGIHINCSQNVSVSDCTIVCGDDGVVVRAYSAPLGKDTPCEKVSVTNCNITSHSAGIRIGWYNDGVIRNCTFSNLTMTDSTTGIDLRLPNTPTEHRGSDQGFEATLVENLNFSDIVMDRIFYEPVYIHISERNLCAGVRRLYFNNIHARGVHLPAIIGRADCPVEDIYFTNCHFSQIARETIPEEDVGPHCDDREFSETLCLRHVKNVVMQDTAFTIC